MGAEPDESQKLKESEVLVRYQFSRSTDEDLVDLTGHGFDGTDVFDHGDNAWMDTSVGPAVLFSHEQDRITVPYASFSGDQGQIRLRVRMDEPNANQVLIRVYSEGGDGLRLRTTDTRLRLDYYHRATSRWIAAQCPVGAIQAGQWYDVVASWSAVDGLVIHLDGQTVAHQELGLMPAFAKQGTITLGNTSSGGHHLRGALALFEMRKKPATHAAGHLDDTQQAPLVFTDDQVLNLGNSHLGFLISKEFAVPVGSIRGKVKGTSLLSNQYRPQELKLWHIALTADRGRGPSLTIDNLDLSAQPSARIERMEGGTRALLEWTGIHLPDTDETAAVTVTIELPNDSKMSYWRLNVDIPPQSKWGVDHVRFPILRLTPPSDVPEMVRMVLPYRWGVNLPDPFYVGKKNDPRDSQREYDRITNYPANMHMQFFALCGDSGASTYFATHDPQGFVKQYQFTALPQQQVLRQSVTHYPEHRGKKTYHMPYSCVLGVFQGDWYDASQIYRAWAVQQPWCAKGTLNQRSDVPLWIKQVNMTVKSATSEGRTLESNITSLDRLTQAFGEPILSCWYHWNEYDRSRTVIPEPSLPETADNGRPVLPKPGVIEALSHFKQIGVYSVAYINSKVYEQRMVPDEDTQAMEPAAIRDNHGNIPIYNQTILPQWLMCRSSDLWQKRLLKRAQDIIKTGFRGVYLDSFGRSEEWCFSDQHGHPVAGGNTSLNGQHRLAERLRQTVRQLDDDAVLISEASVEYFIDVIDAKLLHYDVVEYGCPLWMAVYHDYQTYFGRSYGIDRDANPQSFRLRIGNLFVNGAQLGRFFAFGPSGHYPLTNQSQEDLAFFHQLIALREAHHEFLVLGKMLRPVQIEPVPTLVRTDSYISVEVPSILTASWRAEDGRAAIVLANTNDEPRDVDLLFNAIEYGFIQGQTIQFNTHTADGSTSERMSADHSVRLPVHMKATQAVLIELSSESH